MNKVYEYIEKESFRDVGSQIDDLRGRVTCIRESNVSAEIRIIMEIIV